MKNHLIRVALAEADLRQYQLAEMLGVSETTMVRRLRKELPEEEQMEIVELIRRHNNEHDH